MPEGPATARPLVSVVTVCFNSERHLAEAMGSVLAQSYPEIEYVVVDGGSSDGTVAIIRSFEDRFGGRLRWVSEPDEGIYDAMNKGIAMSTGELVGLLNSDDTYLPGAIERVVEAYLADPGTGAVYGDAEVLDEGGSHPRVERARALSAGEKRPDRMPMCHQSLFVARRTYDEIGTFDTAYRILADYEWILRAIAAGVAMDHIAVPLARFRSGGACSVDMTRSNRERERIRVKYGANPVVERLRRARHALNRMVYAAIRGGRPRRTRTGEPAGESDR
ncbi:MAG: glycosyltransferase [Coriobacteriia bacterium]|nr:glycosyltransferase [Coriobacteriia bacterium]